MECAQRHLLLNESSMPYMAVVVVAQHKVAHALFNTYHATMLVAVLLRYLFLVIEQWHMLGCIACLGHTLP